MAILVTGGAGYIGSHMVWALLDAGYEVVVIDRLSTGFRWAIPPRVRFYEGSVGDAALLERIFSENAVDAIIHFAASIVVPESVADPLSYYENNTGNTRALLSAAVKASVPHFVFSSTAAVYGTPDKPDPVLETAQLRPENPYGQSKLMSEIMLRDTARAHGLKYAVLRYFNVAGADPAGRSGQSTRKATHLIKVACEAALGKRAKVDVYGTDYPTPDGTGVRDYIHVSDLVDAHLKALDYLRNGGESLTANCGYGRGYSVLEVLEAVGRVRSEPGSSNGGPLDISYGPRRPGDAAFIVADPTLARTALGWAPRYDDLDFIVRTALDWERRLESGDVEQRALTESA